MARPSTFDVTLECIDGLDEFHSRRFIVQPHKRAFLAKDDEDSINGVGIGRSSKASSNTFYKAASDNSWIECPTVSRRHAVLSVEKDPPFLTIINVAATHGLAVNDTKILESQSYRLSSGDIVQLSGEVRRGSDLIPPRKFRISFHPTAQETRTFRFPEDESEEEEEDEKEEVESMNEDSESIVESEVGYISSDEEDRKNTHNDTASSVRYSLSANFSDLEDSEDEEAVSCFMPHDIPDEQTAVEDEAVSDHGRHLSSANLGEVAEEQKEPIQDIEERAEVNADKALNDAIMRDLDKNSAVHQVQPQTPPWRMEEAVATSKSSIGYYDYAPLPPIAGSVETSTPVQTQSMSFEKILNAPASEILLENPPMTAKWVETSPSALVAEQSARPGTDNFPNQWSLYDYPLNDYHEGPFVSSRNNMAHSTNESSEHPTVKKSGISIYDIVERSDEQQLARPTKRKAESIDPVEPVDPRDDVAPVQDDDMTLVEQGSPLDKYAEKYTRSAGVWRLDHSDERQPKKVRFNPEDLPLASHSRTIKRPGMQRVKRAVATAARLSATALVGGVGVFLALAFYPEA
ncbi:hypothetical protein EJ05DRAFT_504966 [Pseudovirgaria hyperparasitica]|uniref:FHA domain-containing protein n=1 Tax=Pseudovirgaria hyperparasitica TaxID=470096 RepID=A0A6A6VU47_9PEZI|nr:uncharacterized protein EJ05DRAFT_504966 [Pseudovirgaria hyperparasitica]KAF2753316.1 hypothetical protein EJ05DRAFT_504966 [Pseudovirgaria hyperparasitica]